jgi:hypothetical protein
MMIISQPFSSAGAALCTKHDLRAANTDFRTALHLKNEGQTSAQSMVGTSPERSMARTVKGFAFVSFSLDGQ